MGEALPGFGILPAWTALVIASAVKHYTVQKLHKSGAVTGLAGFGALFTMSDTNAYGAKAGTARGITAASHLVPKRFIQEGAVPTMEEAREHLPMTRSPSMNMDIAHRHYGKTV